jgi:hypothetical protein
MALTNEQLVGCILLGIALRLAVSQLKKLLTGKRANQTQQPTIHTKAKKRKK